MTQALVVGDVIKAQLWTRDSEQASVNTFHYKVSAVTGIVPSLEDFLAEWLTALAPSYKALLCASAHLDGGLAQVVFPLPLMVSVKSQVGAGIGGVGEPAMSRQTAGLISWSTPLAGPGGRGRTYIPFPSTLDSAGIGIPDPAYIAKLTTFGTDASTFQTVGTAPNTATVQIGIRQSKTGNFIVFSGVTYNAKWATQKRRGSYGRPNASPVA